MKPEDRDALAIHRLQKSEESLQAAKIMLEREMFSFICFADKALSGEITACHLRPDGALVRLITPFSPNEDAAQAEARLTAFIREIVPVLNDFLPN